MSAPTQGGGVGLGGGGGGGGGGTTRGRASGPGLARSTGFDWREVDVTAFTAVTGEGEATAPKTALEHVRRALGVEAADVASDPRPTLVFFHWQHDGDPARIPAEAKESARICAKVLDDETAARWGLLFRCVQVDPSESDRRVLAALGADGKPGMVVLDPKTLAPVHRWSDADLSSSARFVHACQAALAKFPAAQAALDAALAAQGKTLAQARAHAKAGRVDEALDAYGSLLGRVRVGPAYDPALLESTTLREKAERAARK